LGTGAYSTTLALYSQYFFWMPNGRILRTRLDLSYSISGSASVRDVSVYGTGEGFKGRARPGNTAVINAATVSPTALGLARPTAVMMVPTFPLAASARRTGGSGPCGG